VAASATRFFDLGVNFQNPLVPWSQKEEEVGWLVGSKYQQTVILGCCFLLLVVFVSNSWFISALPIN
jgi:hypothetical protein